MDETVWFGRKVGCKSPFEGMVVSGRLRGRLAFGGGGTWKFLSLWVCVAVFEIVGMPFAYHKFAGGLETQFVGYFLDYRNVAIGVSTKRGKWLLDFLAEFRRNNFTIHMRRFSEFLGRLGFLCRVLLWVKPHLSPLYSWAAALDRSTVAKAPKLVILTCLFLEEQLTEKQFMLCCRWPVELKQEVFRTDAKCEGGRIVLGGHGLGDGRWFSLEFGESDLPCLFKDGGDSQWASTPAELLAVMFALHRFGCLECTGERREVSLAIQGGTDNKANDALSKRASSTKWPLMLVNMQYSHLLKQAGLRVNLQWRPRDENQLADDLTNLRFDGVDMSKRVQVEFEDLDLTLLKRLWIVVMIFLTGNLGLRGLSRFRAVSKSHNGLEIIRLRLGKIISQSCLWHYNLHFKLQYNLH